MVSSINSSMAGTAWTSSTSMQRPQGRDPFEISDTDGDGAISQTELDTVAAAIKEVSGTEVDSDIATYDSDGDGTLSSQELMDMLAANGFGPPDMQGTDSMQGPPPPPPPGDMNSVFSQDDSEDPFSIADTDGDGVVSSDELSAVAADIEAMTGTAISTDETFSQYDTNENGSLEQDEYMAMLAGSGMEPPDSMQGNLRTPPPSSQEAIAAYTQYSSDPLSQLLDVLSGTSSEESSTTSSISVTS